MALSGIFRKRTHSFCRRTERTVSAERRAKSGSRSGLRGHKPFVWMSSPDLHNSLGGPALRRDLPFVSWHQPDSGWRRRWRDIIFVYERSHLRPHLWKMCKCRRSRVGNIATGRDRKRQQRSLVRDQRLPNLLVRQATVKCLVLFGYDFLGCVSVGCDSILWNPSKLPSRNLPSISCHLEDCHL